MGTTENHRLMAGGSRLRAHVVFGTPKGPKFITLADLLSIMHEESQEYKLLSVRQAYRILNTRTQL